MIGASGRIGFALLPELWGTTSQKAVQSADEQHRAAKASPEAMRVTDFFPTSSVTASANKGAPPQLFDTGGLPASAARANKARDAFTTAILAYQSMMVLDSRPVLPTKPLREKNSCRCRQAKGPCRCDKS